MKKKMNLKQMEKSNKKNRRRERQTERQSYRMRHRERKRRHNNEKPKHTGCLFTPDFQKAVKLTERGRENTKACVLIFCLRAPPGPLKLA